MNRIKHFLILALALTLSLGAWAQGQLLTTVTATGQTSYSQSPDGIVTVTLNIGFYDDYDYGWLGGTVTVEANQGYTITRCVFKQNTVSIADDLAPFTATLSGNSTDNVSVETSTGHVNGDADHMIGITSIEVYGHAAAPDPTVPALDETTGHWNFLMPGSNKVVKAVLYDSIVLGPHVTLYDATPAFADGDIYTRGDSTIYYYDTLHKPSFYLRADEQAGGKYFGYWADLDPTDPLYSFYLRYISPARFTCGDTFRAVYLENYTLSLVTPQGGGTLEIASVGVDTVYTITLEQSGISGDNRSFTIPASRFPYDTTFSYNANITSAYAYDQMGEGVDIFTQGDNWITVRISGPFKYGGYYSCELEGGASDDWTISCTAAGTQPKMPYGITKTGDNTYSVMEGLTVSVTATPDSAHYLASIDGHDTVGNYATGYSFVMPSDDKDLLAVFNAKPTLTLTQTDGGTLEAIVPQGGAIENISADMVSTGWDGEFETLVTEADMHDWGFMAVDQAVAAAWTGAPASGTAHLIYEFETDGRMKTLDFYDGTTSGASSSAWNSRGYIYNHREEFYFTTGTGTSNVIASSTPNTYIIDYGTPVTVVATPDAQHYLVRFSDDDPATERNDNFAVEKTYDSVINSKTLSANFQAKPTLTLTANDGGTLTLDGYTPSSFTVSTFEFPPEWSEVSMSEFIKAEDLPADFTPVTEAEMRNWNPGIEGNCIVFFRPHTNDAALFAKYVNGVATAYSLATRKKTAASTYEGYQIYYVNSSTPAVFPAGVVSANATADTFVVDYNTDVTVVATPDATHYLATLGGVTMGSNTAKDTTFAVTATTNLDANFAPKPTLTLAHNDGGEMEVVPAGGVTAIVPPTDKIALWESIYAGSLWGNDMPAELGFVAVDGEAAEAWTGVPASGEIMLIYDVDGDYFYYLGFNDGSLIGDYGTSFSPGSFYDMASAGTLYITTGVTPSNVIASTEPNTYYIDYNTSVTVKATPSDTAYLVRFDQDADTNSNTAVEKTYGPLTAAHTTAEATFNDKPVLTLAASDTTWGKVSVELAMGTASTAGEVQIGDGTGTTYYFPIDNYFNYSCTEQIYTADEIGTAGTINSISFYYNYGTAYTASNVTMYLKHVSRSEFAANTDCEPLSANDIVWTGSIAPTEAGWYTFTLDTPFEYNGTDNLMVAFFDGTSGYPGTSYTWRQTQSPNSAHMALRYYSDSQSPDPYNLSGYTGSKSLYTYRGNIKIDITPVTLGLPEGVVKIDSVTYRVDYGTTVTVNADATELHHVKNWVDADSVAYPAANITYANYFITEPEPLFPAFSTLTLTVTADTMTKAIFGINSYDVTATASLDSRAEVGTGLAMGTISATYVAQDGTPDQTVAPDTAIAYTAQGGSPSTLVATPRYGYLFKEWVDQNTLNTLSNQDTLTLTEAATVVAVFVPDTFEVVTFTATPADTLASAGTVTGADRYAYRTLVTLEETPATGYHFVNWSNTARTALGTETTVTVQLMQDTAIFAVMDTNVYNVTYTVQTDDRAEIGTGLPMGTVVLEGRHMHFLNDTLSVVPAYGFLFTGWYEGDVLASEQDTFIFSPTEAVTYEARFVPDTFSFATATNREQWGIVENVTPDGRYPYLTVVTMEAVPVYGYHLNYWSDNDTHLVRTFSLTQDTSLTANFIINSYNVYFSSADPTRGTVTSNYPTHYLCNHNYTAHFKATPAEYYRFDHWSNGLTDDSVAFRVIQDTEMVAYFVPVTYNVTAVSDSAVMGTVTGGGEYDRGTTVTLEAEANYGYHFVQWQDGDTTNPRSFVLLQDTAFHAEFFNNSYNVSYSSANPEQGSVVGTVPSPYSCNYLAPAYFKAIPVYGYHFDHWSNGSTEDSIAFDIVQDTNLVAYFAVSQFTVEVTSADSVMGSVSGSGSYDYLTDTSITATPEYGYHFVAWNDGDTNNPRSISVTADASYTANFAVNQYTVTGENADTVGGTVSGSATVDYLSTVTLTATPANCYEFVQWNDGVTTATRTDTVKADVTYTAEFVSIISGGEETREVCDQFKWNGTVYALSGDYQKVLKTAAGCDSTATLHLTVKNSTQSTTTVEKCESYTWHNVTYTTSTLAHFDTINAVGCDSTANLNLTIHYNTSSEETVVTCDDVYIWNGITYTSSTIGTWHTTDMNGCDSTATLNLTLNNNFTSTDVQQACESYTWIDGVTYTESTNTPTYVFHMANGCDSTVTLDLTISNTLNTVETITACDSFEWHGVTYTASTNEPTYSTTSAAGCDSIVTLHLTINNSVETSFDAATCSYYIWDGTYYNESGSYSKHYTAANGCDSTVTMNLTVSQVVNVAVSDTACGSYTWNDVTYTASGAYTQHFTGSNNCDSTVTLTLTVKQPTTATVTASACDSYTWHGTTYTETPAVAPTYTTTGSNGCDSVTTLQLTVRHATTGTETLVACDSIEWHGTVYTASNNSATYSTTNAAGCDSTVTLNLTIKQSVAYSFADTACSSYNWDGTNLTESGSYSKSYTAANGCDSIATLNLTISQVVNVAVSDTACSSYTWNGTTYATSGVYTQTFAGSNNCDSIVNLTLTINNPTTATVVASACDSYEWHGVLYTETPAEAPTYTTTGSNGCDSVTTLQLVIVHSGTSVDTVEACDSYTWIDGVTYTASTNEPTYTITGEGCNVEVTLNLTIKNSVEQSFNDTACNYFIWDGTYYNASGSYTKSYTAANGCDSTATLILTINQPVTVAISETACGSYTWNNVEYAASGAYTQSFTGSNGCDSTVNLTLTVKQPTTATVTASACESYEWHGVTYTETPAVAPTYTTTGSNGCDSVTTLQLTVRHATTGTETLVACDSIEWHGTVYTASNNSATYSTTNAAGCDSTVTLNLTIKQSVAYNFADAACGYYIWNGTYYGESGSYSKSYTAANGCDSIATLTLTVNQPVTVAVSDTACVSYTWNGVEYTASGAYSQTFTGSNNCDSTVTLTLTVKQPTTATVTATACDSYEWHGALYTETPAVAPTYVTTGANGCDSVTTLILTINHATTGVETVEACDSYEWHGTVYTASNNTATYNTTNAAGCDSTVTLNLTINQSVAGTISETACVSYTWNGVEYTTSGVYTQGFTGSNGCDSIVSMTLTISQPVAVTVETSACDSYEWNGVTYTESGVYTYATTTVAGCDSTVTLTLTVNHSTYSVLTMQGEGSIEWNGETFTESGVYERTLTNAAGCDSVVTLVLAILPEGTPAPYLYNLMDVMLTINHNDEGMEDVHYAWYRWYRDGEMVLEGPDKDSYSENGNRLNGCYYLEVATDESMEYWVRSNEVCIGNVGIEDVKEINVTLAPNPVMRGGMVILAVEAGDADLQSSEIHVYDAQGRTVMKLTNTNRFEANLASGVYMVRLTLNDGRSMVKRLIVK